MVSEDLPVLSRGISFGKDYAIGWPISQLMGKISRWIHNDIQNELHLSQLQLENKAFTLFRK